jgi:ribonuclease HII
MARGMVPFDRRALAGAAGLVGIDEAGRGCLAGPVVAAAVRVESAFYGSRWCRRHAREVDDSKRLSPARRAAVVRRYAEACHEKWIRIGVGRADVAEIERFNIHQATALAMRRALEQVLDGEEPGLWSGQNAACAMPVLIDGRPIRGFAHPHSGVVKGDQRSLAIALAGIHAKEQRDACMVELDALHPGYGFAVHKGYGTAAHLQALRRLGPCPQHRRLFLRKFHAREQAQPGASQGSLL